MSARVLPLALVVGLIGAGQSDSAGALGPAILLSITVSPAATSITQGATQQFTATGTYSDLSTKNLTDTVTWSSSSSSTATISNAHGSQGLATATGTGATTITASDPATPLPATAVLTVTPSLPIPTTTLPTIPTTTLPTIPTTTLPTIPTTTLPTIPSLPAVLVSVTVTPPVANVAEGAGEQFSATGTYSDLSTRDLTDAVTWSSSSSGTATVSNTPGSQGLATGVGDGVATITATDPAALVSGTAALTVTPIPPIPAVLVAVTVTPPVANVAEGAGEQFSATGTYSDLSTRDLTDSVTWSSSSSGTATVSNTPGSQGLATGVGDGVATITATDPAALVSGTAALTVTAVATPVSPAPSVPQLALTPASGVRKAEIGASGSGFTPGETISVTYLSGLKARKRASTLLCHATAAANGTFSCSGTIPRVARSGKKGKHMIEATGPAGETGTANFTLVRGRPAT